MSTFTAIGSDLALRLRRKLNGSMRRLGTAWRTNTAMLLFALAVATLPAAAADRDSRGTASDFEQMTLKIRAAIDAGKLTPEEGRAKLREARVWHAAMAADPNEWSEELKAMILELKPDSTIEEIAEGVRQRQQHAEHAERASASQNDGESKRIWRAAMATDPSKWSEELIAKILQLKPGSTIEEIADAVRQRQARMPEKDDADRMRELREGIIARAMAEAPERWSDELKARIERAGWDLEKFTEGIRQRQAAGTRVADFSQLLIDLSTSVQNASWGETKRDVGADE
ncbi:MAG: hypothetical protein VX893_16750 [Candidatus Latescibacterota bacterium]|nr:hypothetical protein [Candidatus Latescibacterota bacterium]